MNKKTDKEKVALGLGVLMSAIAIGAFFEEDGLDNFNLYMIILTITGISSLVAGFYFKYKRLKLHKFDKLIYNYVS